MKEGLTVFSFSEVSVPARGMSINQCLSSYRSQYLNQVCAMWVNHDIRKSLKLNYDNMLSHLHWWRLLPKGLPLSLGSRHLDLVRNCSSSCQGLRDRRFWGLRRGPFRGHMRLFKETERNDIHVVRENELFLTSIGIDLS